MNEKRKGKRKKAAATTRVERSQKKRESQLACEMYSVKLSYCLKNCSLGEMGSEEEKKKSPIARCERNK